MKRLKRLYLAGPIHDTTDQQATAWRDEVTNALADYYVCVSPMVRDYRGQEDANVAAIVEGDIADIDTCDTLLAYRWRASDGTPMEVLYAAKWRKIPVHVVVTPPVSPWLSYHATIHLSLGDAVVALARLA